jgi:hypothetical protein
MTSTALREQIERARIERYSADEIAMVLRAAEGITTSGVPEAVVRILEDHEQPRHARRYAAYILGTMHCAAARDALRTVATGEDPDPGMADQATDALEALRRSA